MGEDEENVAVEVEEPAAEEIAEEQPADDKKAAQETVAMGEDQEVAMEAAADQTKDVQKKQSVEVEAAEVAKELAADHATEEQPTSAATAAENGKADDDDKALRNQLQAPRSWGAGRPVLTCVKDLPASEQPAEVRAKACLGLLLLRDSLSLAQPKLELPKATRPEAPERPQLESPKAPSHKAEEDKAHKFLLKMARGVAPGSRILNPSCRIQVRPRIWQSAFAAWSCLRQLLSERCRTRHTNS